MESATPAGLCFVTFVDNDLIHLEGANGSWRRWLRDAGLEVSWWRGGVPFAQRDAADLGDFLPKMATLARLGVCFAEDYKQGMAPADIMRDLQERGLLRQPFVAVSWGGPKGRLRVRHDPPAG